MRLSLVVTATLLATGCASVRSAIPSSGSSRDVVVVNRDARSNARPRGLTVPPGHYPPPGQCRLWYSGRPPGHQPKPASCRSLMGHVPAGAFVLYNSRAWDMDHDWLREHKQKPGAVPDIILRLSIS